MKSKLRNSNQERQQAVGNMYVDPSIEQSEMSMSDPNVDVKEATEALKGMLGLGSSAAAEADAAPLNGDTEQSGAANDPSKAKKKKRNKKKKPQVAAGALETPPKPKPNQPSGSASKSKQKNKKAPSTQKKKKSQSESSENFAWSAFQSSPDASKLPIPAFSPTPTTQDTIKDPPDDEEVPDLNLSEEKTSSINTEDKAIEPTRVEIEDAPTTTEGTGLNLAAGAPPQLPTNAPTAPQFPQSRLPTMPPPPPLPPNFFPPPMPHAFAPPGFVTIRVQLPPVLPANRTLIVANPAGFPVQVHIPEQYAPNQIISINVPSGPPLPAMPFHHR